MRIQITVNIGGELCGCMRFAFLGMILKLNPHEEQPTMIDGEPFYVCDYGEALAKLKEIDEQTYLTWKVNEEAKDDY